MQLALHGRERSGGLEQRSSIARRAAVVFALIAMLTSGCELIPSSTQEVGRGQVSLRPLLDSDSVAIPGTGPADVIAALGEPTSSEVADAPEDDGPGTVTTMRYDGLHVVVYEITSPERAYISDLVISNRTYVPSVPVTVGTPRSDVERLLGEPFDTQGSTAYYDLTDDDDRCVVTYNGDRAQVIAFRFS